MLSSQNSFTFSSISTTLLTTVLSLFPADKGLPHRPRPASPFSTDGSTVGTHSLGHQRAPRPTRKHKGPGTAPHRRDASADGELQSSFK